MRSLETSPQSSWSVTCQSMVSMVVAALIICPFALTGASHITLAEADANHLWSDVNVASIQEAGMRLTLPYHYRALALDIGGLRRLLHDAPMEAATGAMQAPVVLPLPLPNGRFGMFAVVESPIMEPTLAAKYAEIKTFLGQGLDDPTASVRFDLTPAGFHAIILSVQGTVYINPLQRGDDAHYIVYDRRDAVRLPDKDATCVVLGADSENARAIRRLIATTPAQPIGEQLRTYRLACAATGEWTQFFDGTVEQGMAAIITVMNRVNAIYERDVAIRLSLVANNDKIVYTDPLTDPYTNDSVGDMLNENQSNLDDDDVIGDENYDIGHVLSTASVGSAYLGTVCTTSEKARGVSGVRGGDPGDPINDAFIAHEMGHQFSANHTMNSDCMAIGAHAETAYEPGSGTTIMSYAGFPWCEHHWIQTYRDEYFHTANIDEIVAFMTVGAGANCPLLTNTGNNPPIPSVLAGGFSIPISTPFTLTGLAVDPDGDVLTYCWEEYDLGDYGPPNCASCDAPIFRSFPPTTSPSRTFPQMSDILNNAQTLGEILPNIDRILTFRLTVRDNRAGGGGVANQEMTFNVTAESGPFLVTSPNTALSWSVLTPNTVTWDVANTDSNPVDCANVNILLSIDGGASFPITLANQTPNDGSQVVFVPDIQTASARIKVEAANNIFFDISDHNFTIGLLVADLDIRPGSCPNPLNTKSKGRLPVALLGTGEFDVDLVDVPSLLLEGVAPMRSSVEDVGTPFGGGLCDCTAAGPDGVPDLVLHFRTQDIVAALGPVTNGEMKVLTLTGQLVNGTPFELSDCMVIRHVKKNP